MRLAGLKICFGLVLVCSSTARSDSARAINGGVTDVGPEAGITTTGDHSFLFSGPDDILVTAGRAGVHKTTNGGQTWVRSERGLINIAGVEPYIQSLCQSPSEPQIAYATTLQDGVYRTSNFGESWDASISGGQHADWACVVDPLDSRIVYALSQLAAEFLPGRLFKSTDGGLTFSTVGAGLPEDQLYGFALALAPTDPLTLYVGLSIPSGGLFISSDGGLNFQSLPNSPSSPFLVYAHPTDDGSLLVFADTGLFLSVDHGDSFELVGEGLPPAFAALAFDPVDPTVVYAPGGTQGLFRSVDGARTFERIDALEADQLRGLGVTAVAVGPRGTEDPVVIYAGTSLGPIRSDDGGSTFVTIHDGYRGVSVNSMAIDAAGRLLLATINSIGVFRSVEPGVYETISDTLRHDIANRLSAVAAAPDDPDLYVVGGGNFAPDNSGVFRTTDGGLSWTQATIAGEPSFYTRMAIAFAPSDSRRVYMVSGSGTTGLFRSDDAASSFTQVANQTLNSIAVDPRNPDVLYVGNFTTQFGLFKSVDGGVTLQFLSNAPISSIAVDPERPEIIYAGLFAGSVVRSLDGGQTFTPAGQGLSGDRAMVLGTVPAQPTRLFVWMHAGGLFRSNDRGDSWIAVDTEETLRRSNASLQTSLAIDQRDPEHVYLGSGSVLQFVDK